MRLGKRYREPVARSDGSQASTEFLDCSVISNWTGRPVFICTTVARRRIFPPEQMSSSRSLTRSQARSFMSIARLKIARSRLDLAILISRRTRMDQRCFASRGFFWPMNNPLFQGRWDRLIGRAAITDPLLSTIGDADFSSDLGDLAYREYSQLRIWQRLRVIGARTIIGRLLIRGSTERVGRKAVLITHSTGGQRAQRKGVRHRCLRCTVQADFE